MSFVVYKSSAGSGKTYTLVKEYLKLALQSPSPFIFKNILAITFTNKAAAEMKERVLGALAKLSALPNDKNYDAAYTADICNSTGLSEQELRLRAQNTFETILHNYSDFAIGTIDSFVHRVVRAFAFDLGIPLSFSVELDADKLLDYAIDVLISRAGTDPALTRALVEFTESRTDEERSWRIEKDLSSFAKTLLDTEGKVNAQKLRELSITDILETRKFLEEFINSYKAQLAAIGRKALEIIENYDIPIEAFAYGRTGIGAYFQHLANERTDKYQPNKNVLKSIEKNSWSSANYAAQYGQQIDAASGPLGDLFRQAVALVDTDYERFNYYTLINKSIFLLALLNELQKIIDEYRAQTGTVHISEFDERLGSVVQNEPVPFVYERLGDKYKYFLIDEFQDTSTTQWHNLLPLIENALAGSDEVKNPFSMVVGDGKQAIYRWRGGDVEQFSKLPYLNNKHNNELLAEREEALIRNFKEQHLGKNFRSKKEIIEFNNSFFEFAARRLEHLQPIYNKHDQEFRADNTGGKVHFEFLPDEPGPTEELTHDELFCQKVFNLINQLKTEGYKYGDIAILTRKNSNGSVIAEYLTERGISVVSDESLLLTKSPAVNLLVSFLRRFANPTDDIATAAVLEAVLGSLNNSEQLNRVLKAVENKETTYTEQLQIVAPGLLNPRLKGLSLYELVEEVARILGLTQIPDAYLQQFLDLALKFMGEQANSVAAFLEWWNEESWKQSVVLPESDEAVKIMTIHKSKGLQFPVVIFSHANWKDTGRGDYEWIDNTDPNLPHLPLALVPMEKLMEQTRLANLYTEEQLKRKLDTLNLLYVAMTRPEERLYVLATLPGKKGMVSDWFKSYFVDNGEWVDGQMVYETDAEALPHVPKAKKGTQSIKLDRVLSANWDEKILISTQAKKNWEAEEPNQATYGRIIHQILAWINKADDTHQALTRALEEGLISSTELDDVKNRLEAILTDPENQLLFAPNARVWAEREILLPDGTVLRPDRVVQLDNRLIIADYKTGKALPAHQGQVDAYADTLRQMGYSNVETKLVYL